MAAWLTRRPVRVYLVRGLRFETATGRGRRFLVLLERLVCRLATHVVFNSASARELAVGEGVVSADKALLLGRGSSNGIDMSRFDGLPSRDEVRADLGLDGSAVVVGFVGRLTADKGIDDIVEVLERLGAEGRDIRLLLIGDIEDADPPSDRTRRVVAEDPRVVVVGWVPDPTALYPAMDLLVFPSRREGLPNVPLEAQACGIPIVGYAATGTVDAVVDGRTARLVPVGDVDALVDAVRGVIDDPDESARLGAAGREWVAAEFARERVWAEWVGAYESWLS
jgi:glycosyltransferase involved in cell wall biosynthesis